MFGASAKGRFDMRQFIFSIFVIALTLLNGCDRPTSLERTSVKLKPGMSTAEVTNLFVNFDHSQGTDFDQGLVNSAITFQTNVSQGTVITYCPQSIGFFEPFELCSVYFDTNGTIAGF